MLKLIKIVGRRKKRQGQGAGSGKGFHTSGRGQKGQKSRTHVHVLFEGYKVKKSLLRRLPMQRGRAKFKPQSTREIVINLEILNLVPEKTEVNIESLVKLGIVSAKDAKEFGVKILGNGKLTKKLTINMPISKSAADKVTKLGGKIINNA
ncbi:50S ribosomal protein L15 [soil metagenome]